MTHEDLISTLLGMPSENMPPLLAAAKDEILRLRPLVPTGPRETRTVWVAFTNTDCTEGRGVDVPIAVCAIEATARAMARHQYVQGADGPVKPMELVKIDGRWYAPSAAISIVEPRPGDFAEQRALDEKREAVAKEKAAGLTDADLLALGFRA